LSIGAELVEQVIVELVRSADWSAGVVLINGHGGNSPVSSYTKEWLAANPGMSIRFHDWWNSTKVQAKVEEIDPVASHASWMENFAWTRIAGVESPDVQKPMINWPAIQTRGPAGVREALGDGNFGGRYVRSDDEMLAMWRVAVEETRALIERW
jgi:creatinine amidohydrolase